MQIYIYFGVRYSMNNDTPLKVQGRPVRSGKGENGILAS